MPAATYIVFGVTSDLSRTKLIPSAFQLWREKKISRFVGVGRKPLSEQDFEDLLSESLSDSTQESRDFLAASSYYCLNFDNPLSYKTLKRTLPSDDLWVIHLALPPDLFLPTLRQMHAAGLNASKALESRVMVEKPFGFDLDSAKKLINDINDLFTESQIYRVDHYLGKSTVREILPFRSEWEAIWNKDFIQSIQVIAEESEGIHNRGSYYDKTGAIRDMMQSHCLELLALLALEQPKNSESASLRQARVDILKKTGITEVSTGQYEGYRKEPHVDPNSRTETYAQLLGKIANHRWQTTKFEIITGKKMKEKKSAVMIEFKPDAKDKLTTQLPTRFSHIIYHEDQNVLEINIDFKNSASQDDAYINLVNDCIVGNHSFFVRNDEVLAAWRVIEPAITYAAETRPKIYSLTA